MYDMYADTVPLPFGEIPPGNCAELFGIVHDLSEERLAFDFPHSMTSRNYVHVCPCLGTVPETSPARVLLKPFFGAVPNVCLDTVLNASLGTVPSFWIGTTSDLFWRM